MIKIILSERSTTQIHLEFNQRSLSVEVHQHNSSMTDGRINFFGEELDLAIGSL
jgi:hypothetical protein